MSDHDDDLAADASPYALAFLESLARDPVPEPEPAPKCFVDNRQWLMTGDCRVSMNRMKECSVDSVVTDPPYHLASIVKRFGGGSTAPKDAAHARHSKGFLGKTWDGGSVAFDPATWAEVYRVLKPGGHLIAFAGTRGYHRLACAAEDAGFEVRDMLAWIYSVAMPLGSKDVGNGWKTRLKPCMEPILLARKPPSEQSVAANMERWGTGALNIDATRVEGRYTPNLAHDGSREVQEAFGFYKGGCERFFYSAKADSLDRRGSRHPTVKPVALIRWLVRMVTPPNGLVLDPFAGSGTTAEAAWREGMRAISCEAEPEYQDDIEIRLCDLGAPKIPFRLFGDHLVWTL